MPSAIQQIPPERFFGGKIPFGIITGIPGAPELFFTVKSDDIFVILENNEAGKETV